jgi:hypothetical protein
VAAAIKGNAMGSKRLHFRHFQNPKWCAKDKIRKFGKYLNRGIWVEFLLATFCRSFKKIDKNGRNKKRWADCETRLRARSDPMMAKRLAASTSNCNPLHYVALSQPSDAQ